MRAVLFVVASAICFGTTGTAQAYGPDSASSVAVGLTRIVAGGVLLAGVAWWVARRAGAVRAGAMRAHRASILVGGAAVLAYQPTFFVGARLNGVAIGAAVTLGAAPVLTGLLEWLLTRTTPARSWLAGTACAVVGVVLLSGPSAGTGPDVEVAGVAASLAAALSYAVYTIATKRLIDADWTPTAAVGSVFGTAAVLGVPFLLFVDLSWVGTWSGVGTVAWLAVVTVVLAYVLFAVGLRALSASTVSTVTLVEPMTACALGVLLLDERLSAMGWGGLLMLLVGVSLAARPSRVDATS